MSFSRLIRFSSPSGSIHYGDLGSDGSGSAVHPQTLAGVQVEVLSGDIEQGFRKTGEKKEIAQLLSPLPYVPRVICIGLNYRQHAIEIGHEIPQCPPVFGKLSDALAGPTDDIHIHPDLQSMLDYEGELTVIIGKDAKNVKEEDAYEYILGYTCGNDVSARNYQLPEMSGGQVMYCKSFDQFAPIGPCIVSPNIIPDPQTLSLSTKVNGEVRQRSNTSDMIFSVKQIIAHCSRATTLRKGTIIQTGTPSGVGWFMEPKGFLKNGDVVEIEFEGIGVIKNKMVFG